MNTKQKQSNKMHYKLRQYCLYMLCAVVINAISFASVANNESLTDAPNLLVSRSSSVVYKDSPTNTTSSPYQQSFNEAQKEAFFKINQADLATSKQKTREQVIAERNNNGSLIMTRSASSLKNNVQSPQYLSFDIYDAQVQLFEDIDYDGYYQTFSVRFDADVYGQYVGTQSQVFAKLYLSRNGGPWELYFTSENFILLDDASEDEFEVLSTLDLGYQTGHYDVLIDLYELGYNDIVATISSEDTDDLYALPLESADRDELVVHESNEPTLMIRAGSFSISGLFIVAIVIVLRFVKAKYAR